MFNSGLIRTLLYLIVFLVRINHVVLCYAFAVSFGPSLSIPPLWLLTVPLDLLEAYQTQLSGVRESAKRKKKKR